MTPEHDKIYLTRALEVSIHIGLVILLTGACLFILLPFLPLISWGIIVSIAGYPAYLKLLRLCGGRGGLAAALFTLSLLALLMLPVILLAGTLVDGTHALIARFQEGTLTIPPPPPQIETWPIIGTHLTDWWISASANLADVLKNFAPQIKEAIPWLLSASAGVGLTVAKFALSIVVAGLLLAHAQRGTQIASALAHRLFGEKGPEYEALIGGTIRSVTNGILGVALIQSAFAALGFLVVGLPGAGLWAMIFLFAAVVQVGVVVLVPAVIYVFIFASTTKATLFLIWCAIVALMDNFLKPLVLGRGATVPIAAVFLGAIGGFMVMGIIGLFVGATVVSIGTKLFLAWLEDNPGPSS